MQLMLYRDSGFGMRLKTVDTNCLCALLTHLLFLPLLPDTTMTVGMTAAARTHATMSPSPSPSSLWAWANSSSPRLPPPPPLLPQQAHLRPPTPATACFPCRSAWAYVSIMTRAGCIFTTPTPWGAFTRGRWIVQGRCIQRSVSWAVARFSWKSSSLPRDWPSEEGWSVTMQFNLWHILWGAGFIWRVVEYNPNSFSEGLMIFWGS